MTKIRPYENQQIVRCKCGEPIGSITIRGNIEFLHVGGILAREVHGICAVCGQYFNWSVSDRLLERIIDKITEK